jgi:hypothetical protein
VSGVLTAEALAVLAGAVADYRTVRVPVVTNRRVYVEVDEVLSRLAGGGRWDSSERAHVYHRDPRPDLERLTGERVMPPPSAVLDKELSYWATPPALAAQVAEVVAGLPAGARVLEPSAGDGALARAILTANPGVCLVCVEVDPGRQRVLERAGFNVHRCPFETYASEDYHAPRCAAVVMNPPFTAPGDRYAWTLHLELAWSLLAPGGHLRAIVPASLGYGRQRRIAAVRGLINDNGGSWSDAPDEAFKASGTSVRTLIVEATKPSTEAT